MGDAAMHLKRASARSNKIAQDMQASAQAYIEQQLWEAAMAMASAAMDFLGGAGAATAKAAKATREAVKAGNLLRTMFNAMRAFFQKVGRSLGGGRPAV